MREPDQKRGKGRPRQFRADAALEAVMLTFWRKGYQGASLDDLVAATGASRASLYQVFGDKRAMLIAALERYAAMFDERVDEVMAAEPEGRAALAAILTVSAARLTGGQAPDGCLRCNSTLELAGLDPRIDRALDAANASFLAAFRRLVDRSVQAGEVDAARAPRVALFLTTVVNGMVTLARSGASRAELDAVVEVATSIIGPA